MLQILGQVVGPILKNDWTKAPGNPRPAIANDYDAVAIVDASATGFGAFIWPCTPRR